MEAISKAATVAHTDNPHTAAMAKAVLVANTEAPTDNLPMVVTDKEAMEGNTEAAFKSATIN